MISDVEFDPYQESSNDRVLLLMAYELRALMEKNENLRNCFQMSLKMMQNELAEVPRIEPISDKERHYHKMHKNSCCACAHKLCVFKDYEMEDS